MKTGVRAGGETVPSAALAHLLERVEIARGRCEDSLLVAHNQYLTGFARGSDYAFRHLAEALREIISTKGREPLPTSPVLFHGPSRNHP